MRNLKCIHVISESLRSCVICSFSSKVTIIITNNYTRDITLDSTSLEFSQVYRFVYNTFPARSAQLQYSLLTSCDIDDTPAFSSKFALVMRLRSAAARNKHTIF